MEAFLAKNYHPICDGIALEGMRLVFENLPRVYGEPGDLDARAHMMSAAAMGAVAFQKGLGAIHSLSHPIGAVYGTHHGTTNAVVMPMVLDYNRAEIEDRINAAAAYLGIQGGFAGFREQVMKLRALLNIPANLTALGVKEAEFMAATQATFKLGISFEGWRDLGQDYIHSFGLTGQDHWTAGFQHFWLKGRQRQLAGDYGDYCLELKAALEGKFAHLPEDKMKIGRAHV